MIANYLFDSVPQDAFWFEGGELFECLASVGATEAGTDPHGPALLGKLAVSWERRPAPLDYYEEPWLNALLRAYAARVQGATVLFRSPLSGAWIA